MAGEELIRVARENLEAFNADDWGRMKATMSSNSVYEEFATQRRIEGADQIIEANRGWKKAFPDAKGIETAVLSGDNVVVQEITWAGTNTGPLQGPAGEMAPTGKPATIRAVMVSTFDGDKIRETRHYFDLMSMLQQLGAAPLMP
jgi:steroid delta-isomerase-like uncharacterized protein